MKTARTGLAALLATMAEAAAAGLVFQTAWHSLITRGNLQAGESVLVVGAGGLGCPALLYLAAAGIGHLGIIDFDSVDEMATKLDLATAYVDMGEELSGNEDDDLAFDLDFDSVDEMATKLDLATAYVDMGDAEGARNILVEVLNEGNDEQKTQAQTLLEQLS